MRTLLLSLAVLITPQLVHAQADEPVDLLLLNAKVWTGNAAAPWAQWVAIRDERIVAVGPDAPRLPAAERLDLGGRLVVPGFNDTHVHFAQAGALLTGVNLLDVSDAERFRERIAEAVARLPAGSWITRGDWGAYEAWGVGSEGSESEAASGRAAEPFVPHRLLIDAISPDHPVLVRRFDRSAGLANARALRELGIESESGILDAEALQAAMARVPEKSFERRLVESRRALDECRRWGVTTVQDMSPPDQLVVYEHLRESGELTCRIHFSPSRLVEYEAMIGRGWTVGAGDEWIRFGTIKTHIDGIMGNRTARFFEPYDDNDAEHAAWRGGWREFSEDLESFERMITAADAARIQLRIHAIGDEGNSLLLDMLERMQQRNGARDRRFRLVHAQVIHPKDFLRMGRHAIIAEVQPYHCADDMRWMEERIGAERCRGAYAFRALADAGCTLAFGSDWPGTNASYYPVNPLYGLYSAVTRQTIKGTPDGGWFPAQKVTLEEALRAYTWAGAYASFEEHSKGTLEPGNLADLAVLNIDLFETPTAQWLDASVDYTIVAGRIVFDRAQERLEPDRRPAER
jgi:predicted amidohydrolase YtcJ